MQKRMVEENQERYNAIAAKEGKMLQEEVEYQMDRQALDEYIY